MNENDLLPDEINDDCLQDLPYESSDRPATPEGAAISIARAGCKSSIVDHGEISSLPTAELKKLTGRHAPRNGDWADGEIDILNALIENPAGLKKEALADEIGLNGPSGQLNVWTQNLISHGYIKPGRGPRSKGYRITQAGRDFFIAFKNGAE